MMIVLEFMENGSLDHFLQVRLNIVGQQYALLLGPTCCVRLHGTTTMLALVAYSLKPVKQVPKFLLLCDRHSVAQQCCALLHGITTMLAS